MGEKMFQTANHAHRTGLIVQYDDGSGPVPAPGLHQTCKIHRDIEMIRREKIGRTASRQHGSEIMPYYDPARMIFQNLTQGSHERQHTQPRMTDLAAA